MKLKIYPTITSITYFLSKKGYEISHNSYLLFMDHISIDINYNKIDYIIELIKNNFEKIDVIDYDIITYNSTTVELIIFNIYIK